MIKPVKISPLNTTNTYYYSCPKCKKKGEATILNRVINTDNPREIQALQKEQCPHCNFTLGEEVTES